MTKHAVWVFHHALTITTIVQPETRKMMRKKRTMRSNALLEITSDAPS